jgi:hypothetical protein
MKAMFVEYSYKGENGVAGKGDAFTEYERLTPHVIWNFKQAIKDGIRTKFGVDADVVITYHIILDDVV